MNGSWRKRNHSFRELGKYDENDAEPKIILKKTYVAPRLDKLHQEIIVRDLEAFEQCALGSDHSGVIVS